MSHVIQALEEWGIDYEAREQYHFSGGTIIPKAQVIHIRAAGNSIGSPSPFCDVYLDVRIAPGKKPKHIKKQLEKLIGSLNIEFDILPFQYSRGYLSNGAEPLVTAWKTHIATFSERNHLSRRPLS